MAHQAPQPQLSLPIAILININIMLGAGIFLNTTLLAQHAGALGCISYVLIGLLLLPLVISIAQLLTIHPNGGFYVFAQKEISPFAGFISAWSYFTAKLASAAVIIHASVITIQQLIPSLAFLHPFVIDCSFIMLLVAMNRFNIKTGSSIQMAFAAFKSIPIFFAILAGFFLFTESNYTSANVIWSGVPSTLPLVIYATMGFEAACSLSSNIKNAKRNAPLAVLISYAIAICIITLYQFFFYGALGSSLALQETYRESYPRLVGLIASNPLVAAKIGGLFNLAIACSALGGSYGILFSNTWNLYILAQHNHVFFSRFFTTLNRYAIPFACVMLEGILCAVYLFVSRGTQTTLQQLASLGTILAYTMSVLALLHAKKRVSAHAKSYIIPFLGLINCGLLIAACISRLMVNGTTALAYFAGLLIAGTLMFLYTRRKNRNV